MDSTIQQVTNTRWNIRVCFSLFEKQVVFISVAERRPWASLLDGLVSRVLKGTSAQLGKECSVEEYSG